jgi:hypothetical protein
MEIPKEVRDFAVGAAREHVYACEEQGGAMKFSRCVCVFPGKSLRIANDDQRTARVLRVNFMVKLLRAHGGCLGRRRRRKTWQAAISFGEPQAGFDPEISEWGNPRGQNPRTA